MVTKAITAANIGINSCKIEVEVDVTNSLPSISIVGLPDSAVSEAKERVQKEMEADEKLAQAQAALEEARRLKQEAQEQMAGLNKGMQEGIEDE